MDTVSVVIPCFNAAAFVEEAVASVTAQTHAPAEIIAVDDGSTDDTPAVLESLRRNSPIPFQVISGPNEGPSAARNRGLARARGTWIQFLDADDVLAPGKFRHQLALAASANPTPAFIAAVFWAVDLVSGHARISLLAEDPWVGLITASFGITSSNLWHAEAVRRAGGWSREMHTSEDPELMFRLLGDGGSVVRDVTCLTTLRRRPDSQWNADLRRSYTGSFAFRTKLVNYLSEHSLLTPEREAIAARQIMATLRSLYRQDPGLGVDMYHTAQANNLPMSVAGENAVRRFLYSSFGFIATEQSRFVFVRACRQSARFVRARFASASLRNPRRPSS